MPIATAKKLKAADNDYHMLLAGKGPDPKAGSMSKTNRKPLMSSLEMEQINQIINDQGLAVYFTGISERQQQDETARSFEQG